MSKATVVNVNVDGESNIYSVVDQEKSSGLLNRFKNAAHKVAKQRNAIISIGDPPIGLTPGLNLDSPPQYIENCHDFVSIQIVDYNESKVSTHTLSNENLGHFLEIDRPAHSKVRWINCSGISFDVIRTLGQKYDLHPLAVEDVFHIPQQVKVDFHEEHLFVSMRLLQLLDSKHPEHLQQNTILFSDHQKLLKKAGGRSADLRNFPRPVAEAEQCYFFLLTDNIVISIFQHQGQGIREDLNTRLMASKKLGMLRKTCDSSFLLHALIDSVVDRYFSVVSFYEEQLSSLENFVLLKPRVSLTRTLHIVGKELSILKRNISPTLAMLQHLIQCDDFVFNSQGMKNNESYIISKFTRTYLGDVVDHLQNIISSFETFDDTAKGLVDLTFNSISHSTNEGMKILAVVSLIFLPLTLLCGIYGMNFDYFPELHTSIGFAYFWILAGISLASTFIFSSYMGWMTNDH